VATQPSVARRGLTALALTFVVAACGETGVNPPLPATRVEAVAGGALTGQAGQTLPDLVGVRVFGNDNQPLSGVNVTFSTSNGGSVDPANATTDGNGIARTRWRLGQTAGANVLTATSGSASATVNATGSAGRAANIALVAGNNQTASASSAVEVAPSVRVTDSFGNLVSGAAVSFSVLSGGGRVTNALVSTNAQGVSAVGSWILGPAAGENTMTARVEEPGVAGNPILFTATATAPTGTTMVIVAGDSQQAPVGRLVDIEPTVRVRNSAGEGVPGVAVTFTVASGGGRAIGRNQTTDATGAASVDGWILGDLPGTNTLTATAAGVTDTVTFTATGTAGQAVSMAAVSQTTQSAPAGSNVSDPPSVVVRDAQGTAKPGIVVTFTVTVGSGTVAGAQATTVTTNANGVATVSSWRLSTTPGPNTVTATSTTLPSVTFNATGTASTPATVAVNAGDNQVAVQGTNVPIQPSVKVTDASGNPVSGATVTFGVAEGGGIASGLTQLTDAQGIAAVNSWQLGIGAPNRLTASVTGTGITGNPVTFTAQSATQITVTTAPAGPLNLNSQFAITVQLRNSANVEVPLAGVQLTIAIASGGGTLEGTLMATTNGEGAASFTGLRLANGATAGARTFTITGAGLTSATTAAINFN
jgi:adhesin/invasin